MEAANTRARSSSNGRSARPLKLVVTGPFSAGKTTLIETISEVAIVGTESDVTDGGASRKDRTTVAMDFGRITFAADLVLSLFGTPGQERFEVMWEVLSEGMLGFIVLVRADDPGSFVEARRILTTFLSYADVPYVVGVTHLDDAGEQNHALLAHVRGALAVPEEVDVVACDPRNREDVKSVMLNVLVALQRRMDTQRASAVLQSRTPRPIHRRRTVQPVGGF